jgi:hypothetical protein
MHGLVLAGILRGPTTMSEQAWLLGIHPWELLRFVPEQTSARKWWLLVLAAMQWKEALRCSGAPVVKVERPALRRLAEGDRSTEVLARCKSDLNWLKEEAVAEPDFEKAAGIRDVLYQLLPEQARRLAYWVIYDLSDVVSLLHELFGNPFQPVRIDPSWRTSDAMALAKVIAARDEFDSLPVLGDALEEAGCSSAAVLGHCRAGGTHLPGCWLIDLLLGKE